jgi:hypothetical protein
MLTTRSKLLSGSSLRLVASPSWNRQFVKASLRASVAGFDKIARYVDAEDVVAKPRLRQGGGPVAACQVEHFHALGDARSGDQRLSALSHARGDAREVTPSPQCLGWVHLMFPPGTASHSL